MRVDYLIKYLSKMPADSSVFCWLAEQDDYDSAANLTPDKWELVVEQAEKWCEASSQDLNDLIKNIIRGITND